MATVYKVAPSAHWPTDVQITTVIDMGYNGCELFSDPGYIADNVSLYTQFINTRGQLSSYSPYISGNDRLLCILGNGQLALTNPTGLNAMFRLTGQTGIAEIDNLHDPDEEEEEPDY